MRQEFKTDLRLVFLTGAVLDDRMLDDLATFADSIGPAMTQIENDGQSVDQNSLVPRAHKRGLKVYPTRSATTRPRGGGSSRLWVDGLFADFPDVAVRARAAGKEK